MFIIINFLIFLSLSCLIFFGFHFELPTSGHAWVYLITGAVTLAINPLVISICTKGIAKKQHSKRVLQSFRENASYRFFQIIGISSPILSLTLAALSLSNFTNAPSFFQSTEGRWIIFASWSALFYIQNFSLISFLQNFANHLDDLRVLKNYGEKAKVLGSSKNPLEMFPWVDLLIESTKSNIDQKDKILAEESLEQLLEISEDYFSNKYYILQHSTETQKEFEEAQFVLHYFLKNFEELFAQSIKMQEDKIAGVIVPLLGKVSLHVYPLDPSFSQLVLNLLTRMASFSLKNESPKAAFQIFCLVKELSRTWIEEDLSYLGERIELIKFSLIEMQEISELIFKHDKSIAPSALKTPFLDLKRSTETVKTKTSIDLQPILKKLDEISNDFSALSVVMQKMSSLENPDTENPPENK